MSGSINESKCEIKNDNNNNSNSIIKYTRPGKHYEKQINEEIQVDNPTQECVFSEPTASGLQKNQRQSSNVLNLVTHEQSKWRKQVLRFRFDFVE